MHNGIRVWSFVAAFAIFVVDFVTKRIVLARQAEFEAGIPLIEGLLRFTYVRNAGAAFGMFPGARWPFVAVSAFAVILLTWLLARGHTRGLKRTAYTLILAGAAGNLVDRIFYGGLVVDFIEMGWRGNTFPVYNVADMGVSIGAAMLVLALLREKDAHPEQARSAGALEEGGPAAEVATSPDATAAGDPHDRV